MKELHSVTVMVRSFKLVVEKMNDKLPNWQNDKVAHVMLFIDFQAITRVAYILCIFNMQYWTKQKIALSYKMVSYMIKTRSNFGASKTISF